MTVFCLAREREGGKGGSGRWALGVKRETKPVQASGSPTSEREMINAVEGAQAASRRFKKAGERLVGKLLWRAIFFTGL